MSTIGDMMGGHGITEAPTTAIKAGDQVQYRRQLQNNMSEVLMGNVVEVTAGNATVSFPQQADLSRRRLVVPVASLENLRGRFGNRARVSLNPGQRNIG